MYLSSVVHTCPLVDTYTHVHRHTKLGVFFSKVLTCLKHSNVLLSKVSLKSGGKRRVKDRAVDECSTYMYACHVASYVCGYFAYKKFCSPSVHVHARVRYIYVHLAQVVEYLFGMKYVVGSSPT